MTECKTFRRNHAPAELDFSVEGPADWVPVTIPDEPTDFSDPTAFAPIGVVMAPYALLVFSVAARPAYDDGTLLQWAEHVTRTRGLDPGTFEHQSIGAIAGVACWGMQVESGTVVRARIAFFEDGGRFVNVTCMAPQDLWNASAGTFAQMLATFELVHRRGSKVALVAEGQALAECTMPGGRAVGAAEPADEAEEPAQPAQAAAVALATDMRSFDPEHELNARLRNNGAGLTPNVLDYHEQEQWATLGAGAIRATMRVPFGWHVIDDGRRTLVFDAGGDTQVSLQLLRRERRTDDAILAEKIPELQREWPTMEHLRVSALGMECLLIRNAVVDGDPIEQAYFLRDAGDDLVLQARATSSPATFGRACDLVEVLLRDLR